MSDKITRLAKDLEPFLVKLIHQGVGGGGGGSVAMATHPLASDWHSGALSDAQGPQFLKTDGSRMLVGNLSVGAGYTVDGVDISAHAANPAAHHAPVTAGDGIALAGQQVAVDLSAVSGLNFIGGQLRVNPGNGVEIVDNLLRVKITPIGGLEFYGNELQLRDTIAGAGLGVTSIGKILHVGAGLGIETDADTTSVRRAVSSGLTFVGGGLAVNPGHGVEVVSDLVRVDEDASFTWAGVHQFDQDPQVHADLDFLGADRSITGSANVTLAPTMNLVLAPTGNVELAAATTLRTPSYADLVTGIDGFALWDRGGNYRQLTIGAMKADELSVRVFAADETRIDRGEEYWSKSYGIVESDFVIPEDEATVDVWFEEAPALGTAKIFTAGDWLLCRVIDWETGIDLVAVWFEVDDGDGAGTNDYLQRADQDPLGAEPQRPDRQQWRLKHKVGGTTGLVVKRGSVVLDAGVVGQGWVHLSALAQDGGPFLRVGKQTTAGDADNAPVHTPYVQMGNLVNLADYGTDAWGLAGAVDLSATPGSGLRGFTLDETNGLRLFDADLKLYAGAAEVARLWPDGLVLRASDGVTGVLGVYTGSASLAHGGFTLENGDVAIGTQTSNYLYWDKSAGSVVVKGQIVVTGGSTGIANFSDKSLAAIDATANTKLGGIAVGATVGATWGTNLSSIPARFNTTPAGGTAAGLYMTANQMGYWSGSAWRTYMDNTGKFYFAGSSGATIAWDGSDLFGQNSSNVTQWYASSSNGKLYAGGGAVVLDANGLKLQLGSGWLDLPKYQIAWHPDPTSLGAIPIAAIEGTTNAFGDSMIHLGSYYPGGVSGSAWTIFKAQTSNRLLELTMRAELTGATDAYLTGTSARLGIGTTSPDRALTVNAAASPAIGLEAGEVEKATWGIATAAGQWFASTAVDDVALSAGGSNSLWLGSYGAGDLHLVTNNARRITIMADGKVGIGNAAPAYALDTMGGRVRGTLAAKSTGTVGYVAIASGDATYTGTISWFLPAADGSSGTRLGYMGYHASDVALNLENGAKFFVDGSAYINNNLTVAGNFGTWTEPGSFGTGWANLDSANYTEASYRKIGDIVQLRGVVKRTSGSGVVIFTLPSGYRPVSGQRCVNASVSSGAACRVDVLPAGDVRWEGGGDASAYVSLDNIQFSTI